ncbi:MAG: NUDIX domain-containing protein [Nanoarchaeota archaeon]|nr:NUDIX domain-containing protein [Nanoarchaeota archaeon]
MNDYVDIAVGIILDGNRFLVEKRTGDNDIDPDLICLPGGHLDLNETLEECVKREMEEEFGIIINDPQFICKSPYIHSNGEKAMLHYFVIKKYHGEIKSTEASYVYWESNPNNLSTAVDREALSKLNL